MISDMANAYATLGYSAETAGSVMGVLVLISSGGQAIGSDVQVRKCPRVRALAVLPGYVYICLALVGYCVMDPEIIGALIIIYTRPGLPKRPVACEK